MDAAGLGAFLLDILEAAVDPRIERVELALLAPRSVVAATAWPAGTSPAAVAPVAAVGSSITPRAALAVSFGALALAARTVFALTLSFRSRTAFSRRPRPASATRRTATAGASRRLAVGRCGGSVFAGAPKLRRTTAAPAARPWRQGLTVGSKPRRAGR